MGGPGLGVEDRSLRLHHPRLHPRAAALQHGPISATSTPPVHQPGVVHLGADAWDIGVHPRPLSAVWPSAGAGSDRIQRPASGSLAGTARQNILRRDGRQPRRTGQVPQCICERRYASWPCCPVCLGKGTASDHCGPGAWCLQALCPCRHGGLQMRAILLGRSVVAPTGGGLVQGIPAGSEPVRIQAPIPIPHPVVLVRSCCVGSPPQGGWRMGVRSASVRQTWPGRATSFRHVLPPGGGLPHR